ncbi:MAG: hypothetical protein ACREN6_17180 [Gemmatimonadaceae bacterium]
MGRMDVAGAPLIWLRALARRVSIVSGALLVTVLCAAHVGSPDAYFEGTAGPYPVRVIIRSPQVIPAQAEIVVRVTGSGVQHVTATARAWGMDARNAPPPDEAVRVAGDTTLWTLQLWIMRQGAYAVIVHVQGAAGEGTATVPYTAVALGVLTMNHTMAVVLAAAGLFLVAGLLTIITAAAGEATLPPGAEADDNVRRRARRVRWTAAAIIVAVLVGGRVWWSGEDRAYAAMVFRPTAARVTVRDVPAPTGGRPVRPGHAMPPTRILRFSLDPTVAQQRTWVPLIPDHGKLLHFFLVKKNGLGAFAHLHPVEIDSLTFETAVPFLPAGDYFVFADVVHENGFAETMVQSVTLGNPAAMAWKPTDPDDAVFVGNGVRVPFRFDDGSTLSWDGASGAHLAGADARLRFTLRDAAGKPLTVQPYMGMAAHAIVVRDDGKVFEHLHPTGTTPTLGAMPMTMGDLPGTLEFPWAFPKAGLYRVWVQFRRGGPVHSAAFDVTVTSQ